MTTETERVLVSIATFFVGEVLHLRPDMGSGRWRVVELLPPDDRGFQRARAVREP